MTILPKSVSGSDYICIKPGVGGSLLILCDSSEEGAFHKSVLITALLAVNCRASESGNK